MKNYFITEHIKSVFRISLMSFFFFAFTIQLSAVTVSSISQLQTEINKASAGTEIIVQNGSYTTSGNISVKDRIGTASRPIIIRAETIGGVTINGKAGFVLEGTTVYVVIKGFVFKHEAYHRSYNSASYCTFTRNVYECIKNVQAGTTGSSSSYLAINGSNNEVSYNTFQNKNFRGPILSLQGQGGKIGQNNWVHHNYFKDFLTSDSDNDNSCIQPGYGSYGNSKANMIIEHNLFENQVAESEGVASFKCWDVTFRYNTVKNCQQTSLRSGEGHKIYGNYFLNSSVRFCDSNHQLYSNAFVGSGAGITLYSNLDPSKETGYSHIRPINSFIGFNTFVKNRTAFISNGNGGSQDLKIVNNIFYDCGKAIHESGAKMDGVLFDANIVWKGDKYDHPNTGLISKDPLFEYDGNGIPSIKSNSPAIDNSNGTYDFVKVDMDGQSRTGKKDIGADELGAGNGSVRVLSAADVGPDAVVATIAAGPDGYIFFANKDEIIKISSQLNIAYGADGKFVFLKDQTTDIVCKTETFGEDPAPGITKHCYIQFPADYTAPAGYTEAVDEDMTVEVSDTLDIAYGVNGKFIYLYNQATNISCNQTAFGSDPEPGFTKKCYIKKSGPEGYSYVGKEKEILNITGTVDIAYGANGQYKYLYNQTEDVLCGNDAFGGDPIRGVAKKCYMKIIEKNTPTTIMAEPISDNDNTLEIYPNPSKGSFTVQVKGKEATEVSIFNLEGKVVYKSNLRTNTLKINQDFKTGIYLLRLTYKGSSIETQKIIIK